MTDDPPENSMKSIVVIISAAAAVLILLSYLPTQFSIGKWKSQPIDILADLRDAKRKTSQLNMSGGDPAALNRAVISSENISMNPRRGKSIDHLVDFGMQKDGALGRIFYDLKNLKTKRKKVRIAYFGDSVVEGDLITEDIRSLLQEKFGGAGVGFVPITSIVSKFRSTISHSFSDNWEQSSLVSRKDPAISIGISGFGFMPKIVPEDMVPNGDFSDQVSWVEYGANGRHQSSSALLNLKLYYRAPAGSSSVTILCDGKNLRTVALPNGAPVQQLVLTEGTPVHTIKVGVAARDTITVYGITSESNDGVILDNFAMRGNSGTTLSSLSLSTLTQFHRYLDYSLIILHFGLNVADPEKTNFGWYEEGMIKVVEHLRRAFPEASFLLISVSDRSVKKGMIYETADCIPPLVDAQRLAAEKTGSAFWNLYEAMGGMNSMVAFVGNDYPLAGKDYTHFTASGAKTIAKKFTAAILKNLDVYENNSGK